MRLSSKVIKGAWVNERESHQVHVRCDLFVAPPPVEDASNHKASKILSEALEAARNQAETILAGAQALADELLAQAQIKIKALEEEAALKGFREGFTVGQDQAFEEARQEAEALRDEAREVVREAHRLRREVLGEVEPEVIDLAIGMASAIVQRQVEVAPDTIINIARLAFQKLYESKKFTVFANPDDMILLKSRKHELLQYLEEGSTVRIIQDPAIIQGGCRVETENGDVDATIEGQIRELTLHLRGDQA
ncbi:MAG: FliH/SctL family protein [Bacillota bacterium]